MSGGGGGGKNCWRSPGGKGRVWGGGFWRGWRGPRVGGGRGLGPPLLDSEWVLGPPARLPRILMHGVSGSIAVTGVNFRLEMPGLPDLNDRQIASVLTYIRREWEHGGEPVAEDLVAKIRQDERSRREPWTAAELLKIK